MRYERAYIGALLCCFVVLFSSGCAWIPNTLVDTGQSKIEAWPGDTTIDFVRVQKAGDDFLTCMRGFGGKCGTSKNEDRDINLTLTQPVPAFRDLLLEIKDKKEAGTSPLSKTPGGRAAMNVLTSPPLEDFINVFNYVAGASRESLSKRVKFDENGKVPVFDFGRRDLQIFAKDVQDGIRFDGFSQVNKAANYYLAKLAKEGKNRNLKDDERSRQQTLTRLERMTAYIESYTKAYFRDGHFVAVDLDENSMKQFITEKLKPSLPGFDANKPPWQDLINSLAKDAGCKDNKCRLVGKVSDISFKTRGGVDYKFPAITVILQPAGEKLVTVSKVDFVGVGADLIRVFIEAIGDALAGVPGVTEATGCNTQVLTDAALPVFDPKDQETHLTTDDFSKVNMYANQVEAATSTVIGRVIRGASWFSLNNESLAVLIEAAVGVIVKKASEKVLWCGFCVWRKDNRTGEGDALGFGKRSEQEVVVPAKFVISGPVILRTK